MNRVLDDVARVVVGLAELHPGLHAASRHPDGEAPPVVIATVIGRGEAALAINGASEFPAPDHTLSPIPEAQVLAALNHPDTEGVR